jgi:YVTN family beta-propeller protein
MILRIPGRRILLLLGALAAGGALANSNLRAATTPAFRVMVTNERTGTLSVLDGATSQVIATGPLGKRPRGLKTSPDGKLLYVALSGSPIAGPGVDEKTLPPADKGADGIGVVDLATLKLLRVLRGVSDPEQLAVSADGKRLFVASEDTGQGIVLDSATGKVIASVAVGGEPEGVTLSPDGKFVYMSSEADHHIAVIDAATTTVVTTFNVGERPRFTEFSDDGAMAYVSAENDGTITVVDARRHAPVRTIKLQGAMRRPVGMVVSHDGKRLFVVTGRDKQLLSIDIASGTVLGSVEVGQRPWGVVLSPDGKRLFTANGSSNDVTVVDATTLKVIARVPVGDGPWGAVVVPASAAKPKR